MFALRQTQSAESIVDENRGLRFRTQPKSKHSVLEENQLFFFGLASLNATYYIHC